MLTLLSHKKQSWSQDSSTGTQICEYVDIIQELWHWRYTCTCVGTANLLMLKTRRGVSPPVWVGVCQLFLTFSTHFSTHHSDTSLSWINYSKESDSRPWEAFFRCFLERLDRVFLFLIVDVDRDTPTFSRVLLTCLHVFRGVLKFYFTKERSSTLHSCFPRCNTYE